MRRTVIMNTFSSLSSIFSLVIITIVLSQIERGNMVMINIGLDIEILVKMISYALVYQFRIRWIWLCSCCYIQADYRYNENVLAKSDKTNQIAH